MDGAIENAAFVTTVAQLLRQATAELAAAGVETARLDAEVLLGAACNLGRTALFARLRDAVPAESEARFAGLLRRRAAREPLQYIVGQQEFWSLQFAVTPDVLVPRPETELLVEVTIERLGGRASEPVDLCDMGTGSGCVAISLARALPNARVAAVDVSSAALAVAAANARRHGVADRVRFIESDLFAQVPLVEFDAIVANPPYVGQAALPGLQPEVCWEPRSALDGGIDGLEVIERLLAEAGERLRVGGFLAIEIGADQDDAAAARAAACAWTRIAVRRDAAGLPRVLVVER